MNLQVDTGQPPATMTATEFAELVGAVPVKLVRDTLFTVCLDCGMYFDGLNGYWGWRKSEASHIRLANHHFQRYGWPKEITPCNAKE